MDKMKMQDTQLKQTSGDTVSTIDDWSSVTGTTRYRPPLAHHSLPFFGRNQPGVERFFWCRQGGNQSIQHTDRLLGSIGNRCTPFWCVHVLHLCWGYWLFAAMICVPENFLLLGSMMRQWPISGCFHFFSGVLSVCSL